MTNVLYQDFKKKVNHYYTIAYHLNSYAILTFKCLKFFLLVNTFLYIGCCFFDKIKKKETSSKFKISC